MSGTLKAIVEMRRQGPDGADHAPDAYVFGNEAGEPVSDIKRAWQRALLVANGHKPEYAIKTAADGLTVKTALLTPESQQRLRDIDLHFHDLRREAGSRWLDAGVPLHRIQKWLGHTNIAQTSTYLMADSADNDAVMQRFEEQQARLTTAGCTHRLMQQL
jgi:integrase